MVTLSGRSSSAVSVPTCTLIILGAAQAEATVTACNRSGSAMNVAIAYVPADPPGDLNRRAPFHDGRGMVVTSARRVQARRQYPCG